MEVPLIPYTATSSSGSSTSSSTTTDDVKPPPLSDIDGFLAGAGYKVKSSDLRHVAQRLEKLESAMVNSSSELSTLDAVHYNPTDMASWVDSLLSEFTHSSDLMIDFTNNNSNISINNNSNNNCLNQTNGDLTAPLVINTATAPTTTATTLQQTSVVTAMMMEEEDSGIRLVHLLMTCADAVTRGELPMAGSLIEEMNNLLATRRVNSLCGIGKVAGYFIDALSRRIFSPAPANVSSFAAGSAYENEILYHHYYEACPYLKFAHFTANQAILEAFEGHDCVHVVDFNLMHGLQWPALIQALALRPGGPPLLRLTGIGPPSPDGRDSLREIGMRLAELARSVHVRFAFRGVAAARLEDVKPWMLQVSPKEAVAVNSIMQLHKLLGPDPTRNSAPIDTVLDWIRSLNPKIMTVVEQEANHNQTGFLDRFSESLYYYSTMFDSLEGCTLQPEKALAEMYIQREICNIVCCEGPARVERHEPLAKWRERLELGGFRPLHLGSNAFKQASMLLTLFSSEGYSMEEKDGCLTLGWHSRPLVAASAWQVLPGHPDPNMNNLVF